MENPFESISIRLSNIEDLLLDIKHDLVKKIPKNDIDFHQVFRDRKINRQTYNSICVHHKIKTLKEFLELPLSDIRKTRGIGSTGYAMCIEAKEHYSL